MDLSGLSQALLETFSDLPDKGEELSVQDTGPETFPQFPKLPIEIRFNIWKLNLPPPRLLKVSHDPKKDEEAHCYSPTPTLLHVNQESRSEALRRYLLLLPSSDMDESKPIYYRSEYDKIYFLDIDPITIGSALIQSLYWGASWFDGIECLVLRGMELGKRVEEELRDGYIWAHVSKGTPDVDNLVLPARQSPILFFRRLASIHLILDDDFDDATDEEIEEMEGVVKKLFKEKQALNPVYLIPSVMIYRYDQRSVVSVFLA
ncbi:hypothetical protein DL95DRAFT_406577 [Leptodontidium sp. 2 PMI_412]|nr:hypothetical protein DL95DRAFT_406577 [Leptodontidium sp. 2 PMI_412]